MDINNSKMKFQSPYFVTHTYASPEGPKRAVDRFDLLGERDLPQILEQFRQIKAMFPDAELIDLNASTLVGPKLSPEQEAFLAESAQRVAPNVEARDRGAKAKRAAQDAEQKESPLFEAAA
jgi:hypothetical protein